MVLARSLASSTNATSPWLSEPRPFPLHAMAARAWSSKVGIFGGGGLLLTVDVGFVISSAAGFGCVASFMIGIALVISAAAGIDSVASSMIDIGPVISSTVVIDFAVLSSGDWSRSTC